MASTDIRSMLSALEGVQAQSSQNAAQVLAQGVTIASTIAEMVVERVLTVQSSAFVLDNGVYIAMLEHNLDSLTPGIAVYDNDNDLQLAQAIGYTPMITKLELTASQYADASFPFKVNFQAKATTALDPVAGMNGIPIASLGMKYRRNPSIAGGSIEATAIGTEAWANFGGSDNITKAHINGEILYAIGASGSYALNLPGGGWYQIPMETFDSTRLTGIVL